MIKKLLVLTTGGTIDKVYFDAKSLYEVGAPVVASILNAMAVEYQVTVKEVCKKDSLEMTDADRSRINEHILASDAGHVLITHGTDTMVESASFIGAFPDKVVVFTGAMQPAAFKETDGIFNIGTALGVLSIATACVYIAMNGQAFLPDNDVNNYTTRRFESK